MKTPLKVYRNRPFLFGGVASAVLLALIWALTLAASPDLHERVHPDAGHEDHDCAAMLFLSGAIGPLVAPTPFALVPPCLPLVRAIAPTLAAGWVLRPIDRAVLEHAPPHPVHLAMAVAV